MSVDEQVEHRELELDEDTLEDLDAESDEIRGGGNSRAYSGTCI